MSNIIMPPVGLLIGHVDFKNLFILLKAGRLPGPYSTLADAQAAGAVTMNIGLFVSTVISFTIVAFCVFMLIRMFNRIREPATVNKPAGT